MLAGIFPGNRSLSAHTAAVASTVLSASALLFHHSAGQEEMTVKEPSGSRQGDLPQFMFIYNSPAQSYSRTLHTTVMPFLVGHVKAGWILFARSQKRNYVIAHNAMQLIPRKLLFSALLEPVIFCSLPNCLQMMAV